MRPHLFCFRERIRRIVDVQERSMEAKMSRHFVAVVAVLFLVSAFLMGTFAQQVGTKAEPKTNQTPAHAAILQILQEAAARADDLKDARSKVRMLVAVAAARAQAGEQVSARASFKDTIQAADAIEDLSQRVYSLEEIAVAQIDSNDRPAALPTMHHAIEVAETIGDGHQRNTARMWIVRTYARSGDVDNALRVVEDLPESGDFKGRALASVFQGMRHSDRPTIKEFLPKLLRTATTIVDPTHQAKCLQGIAEELADSGDVAGTRTIAEILHKAALQYGLQDVRGQSFLHSESLVLSALAKAQAKGGERQVALETFENAVKLADAMPPEGEALRSYRLRRIANDRVDAGDTAGALRTAELVVYEYHKANALMAIAKAQAKAGQRDESRALFRKAIQTAKEIKIRDGLRDRAASYDLNSPECLRTIASVQASAGFAAEAVQTAETIDEPKWKNSALAQIAMAMAKAGEIMPAFQLVDRIDDESARARALQGIAEGQAEGGDISGAVKWARSRTTPEARANALLGIVRAVVKRRAATD